MKNSIDVFADKKAWEADFRCKYLIGIGLVFIGFCSARSGVVYVFFADGFSFRKTDLLKTFFSGGG